MVTRTVTHFRLSKTSASRAILGSELGMGTKVVARGSGLGGASKFEVIDTDAAQGVSPTRSQARHIACTYIHAHTQIDHKEREITGFWEQL